MTQIPTVQFQTMIITVDTFFCCSLCFEIRAALICVDNKEQILFHITLSKLYWNAAHKITRLERADFYC